MRPSRTLADGWLVRYSSFSSTESHCHAPTTSYTPLDMPYPADSNETLADSIRPPTVELPQLSVSFPRAPITVLSLLLAPGTASSPLSVYRQPVYSSPL